MISSPNGFQVFKYVELTNNTNGIIQIRNSVTYTAVSCTTTFYLSFLLPEMMFCDTTNEGVCLKMPDISAISTTTSFKFYVKRTTSNLSQIDIVGYSTTIHNVYDRRYNQNYVSSAIGSSTIVLLYNQAWYEF